MKLDGRADISEEGHDSRDVTSYSRLQNQPRPVCPYSPHTHRHVSRQVPHCSSSIWTQTLKTQKSIKSSNPFSHAAQMVGEETPLCLDVHLCSTACVLAELQAAISDHVYETSGWHLLIHSGSATNAQKLSADETHSVPPGRAMAGCAFIWLLWMLPRPQQIHSLIWAASQKKNPQILDPSDVQSLCLTAAQYQMIYGPPPVHGPGVGDLWFRVSSSHSHFE